MRTSSIAKIDKTPIFEIFQQLGVGKEKIRLESKFENDLDYDDLDWVLLKYFIENKMNVNIADGDIDKITTIGDLVQLVESRRRNIA